jgi:hypothetical protein
MPALQPLHPDLYRRADRLLVMLPWSLGDVLMHRPLLSALRRAAPGAEIIALGAEPAIGLLDDGRLADQRQSYQYHGILYERQVASGGLTHREGLDEPLRAWLDRAGRSDLVFVGMNVPEAALEALRSTGLSRIEPDMNLAAQALSRGFSVQEAWIEGLAAGWGLPVSPQVLMRLDPPDWARRTAEEFFEEHQIADWLPAAISPTSALTAHQWPAERFAEIGDQLITSTRAPLLLLTGSDRAGDAVLAQMERKSDVIVVEPRHALVLAALLQRSRVLVCNDTELLHLAAIVGTPVLGVQGLPGAQLHRPRFPWAAVVSDSASSDDVWETLRGLIPLTVSPTGVHPTHGAIAGAGSTRARRSSGEPPSQSDR